MYKYPKTPSYKDFVRATENEKHPITLLGTVKLHGTNAGVLLPDLTAYSRSRELTTEDDNFGFANFVYNNGGYFNEIYENLKKAFSLEDNEKVVVYGEWAGNGIQQLVAISELPKTFYIFNICIVKEDRVHWIKEWGFKIDYPFIKSIRLFPSFILKYDPYNPESIVNDLENITSMVEKECPVAKQLGVSGVGEGVVWTAYFPSGEMLNFKVKGEKHSKGLKKRKVLVVPESIERLDELVNTLFTEERFEGVLNNGKYTSRSDIGTYIKDVFDDVFKEEYDTIVASGFSNKQVSSASIDKIKQFILKKV